MSLISDVLQIWILVLFKTYWNILIIIKKLLRTFLLKLYFISIGILFWKFVGSVELFYDASINDAHKHKTIGA